MLFRKKDSVTRESIQYNNGFVVKIHLATIYNGMLSQTERKSGSLKGRQLIYRYSKNTIKIKGEGHSKKRIFFVITNKKFILS